MQCNKNIYTSQHRVFVCCVWLSHYNTIISYTASIDVPLKMDAECVPTHGDLLCTFLEI